MHTGHASVQYHAAHVCTSLLSKHCWSALNPHLQAAALSLSLVASPSVTLSGMANQRQ